MYSFQYDSYAYFFDLLAFSLLMLPLWFALPTGRPRRILMILGCLYMLYFVAPRLVVFYLFFWAAVFAIHRLIATLEKRGGSGAIFPAAIIATLAPMVAWKLMGNPFNFEFNLFFNKLLHPLSRYLWEIDLSRSLLTPIGISFATFRAVDLLIKTFLGVVPTLALDEVLFFGFFAPVVVAGPVSVFEETQRQDQKADPQKIYEGMFRIATGFIKIFCISSLLSGAAAALVHPAGLSAGQAWLMLVGFSWYWYLNFSGYSDLAIGIARMYGFELKENFNFPYFRTSIAEYWNSWNMSVTRFVQRNIFVPCGGHRENRQYIALFLSMMTIALWHGLNSAWVAYGLYHSTGLVVQRMYSNKRGEKRAISTVARGGYMALTYLFAIFAFPLVTVTSFQAALPFYKALAGMP